MLHRCQLCVEIRGGYVEDVSSGVTYGGGGGARARTPPPKSAGQKKLESDSRVIKLLLKST